MKTLKNVFIVVYLFISGCTLVANNNKGNLSMELSRIMINNTKIDSLLNIVISDNQDYLSCKDCFLLMNYFHGDNDTNYIRFIPYEKEKFVITCPKNDYSIFGFFEIDNQTVLLVGDIFFDEIRFLDEKKIFTFRCQKEPKRGTVPPPPSMYNPPVYTFLYEKGKN